MSTYQLIDSAWHALGDSSRRAIMARLTERPHSVRDLAEVLPISRPAVSQHLKVLKEAGLVSDRAVGTKRIYQPQPAAILALRDQLDAFWSRTLAAYKDVVEDSKGEEA